MTRAARFTSSKHLCLLPQLAGMLCTLRGLEHGHEENSCEMCSPRTSAVPQTILQIITFTAFATCIVKHLPRHAG